MYEHGYADRVIHEAFAAATGGLDPQAVEDVVTDAVAAIGKQMRALKDATYDPQDYERIARAMSHAAKSLDGVYRLMEFAQGHPDSRVERADWCKALTADQLAQVMTWLQEPEPGPKRKT